MKQGDDKFGIKKRIMEFTKEKYPRFNQ